MNNSYGYHLLCRWLAFNVINCWSYLPYSSQERGNLSQFHCWFFLCLQFGLHDGQDQTHFLSRRKSTSEGMSSKAPHCESDWNLVAEMESDPWAGTFFKDLFLSRSIFLIADFAQTLKQPAYHNLKRKVNLKVTSFKGATSKTFISFTTPLVLGNGLLSFIIPTSSPACLLWVQHQNPSPSIKGWFLAT